MQASGSGREAATQGTVSLQQKIGDKLRLEAFISTNHHHEWKDV
jgi:hypothetical protein